MKANLYLVHVENQKLQLEQQIVVDMVRSMKPGDKIPVELYVRVEETETIFLLKDVIVGSLQNRLHGIYGLTLSGQIIGLGES